MSALGVILASQSDAEGWVKLAMVVVVVVVVYAIKYRYEHPRRVAMAAAGQVEACGYVFWPDGTVEAKGKPRAAVLDATYFDGRQRKSVAGRGLAALATHGASLLASNSAGYVVCNVVTTEWVATVRSKDDLGRLYGLAVQAKARCQGASVENVPSDEVER